MWEKSYQGVADMKNWNRILGRGQPDAGRSLSESTLLEANNKPIKPEHLPQPKSVGEGNAMSDEMISSENLTKEFLKSVFDSAYMEATVDGDGDLMVKEMVNCWVYPSESKDYVTLVSRFGFKESASALERLQCVNSMNYHFFLIRAMVVQEHSILRFDYDIYVGSGVSKKHFIQLVKKFCAVPHNAITKFGIELVK